MQKTIKIWGIVCAVCLIIVGVVLPIPKKEISTFSFKDNGYEVYVGGDAYNIQIEASLRGGIIAGRTVAKAVLISAGILLFFVIVVSDQIICSISQTTSVKPSSRSNTQEPPERMTQIHTNTTVSDSYHIADNLNMEHDLYCSLIEFCPALCEWENLQCKYEVPNSDTMKPLIIERNGDGVLIAHTDLHKGILMYEPAVTLKFNTAAETATVETYEVSSANIHQNFINGANRKEKVEVEDMVLNVLLKNAISNGYELISSV